MVLSPDPDSGSFKAKSGIKVDYLSCLLFTVQLQQSPAFSNTFSLGSIPGTSVLHWTDKHYEELIPGNHRRLPLKARHRLIFLLCWGHVYLEDNLRSRESDDTRGWGWRGMTTSASFWRSLDSSDKTEICHNTANTMSMTHIQIFLITKFYWIDNFYNFTMNKLLPFDDFSSYMLTWLSLVLSRLRA